MINPTISLKIPKTLYKIANEKNLLSEVIFYYSLKSINKEGFFKKGKKIAIIQQRTGLSASRIQQLISSCVELGFLRRSEGTLSLCSYNHLWKHFGFSLDSLKLLRVNIKDEHDVKHLIQYEIISNKIRGIQRKLPKAYIKCLKEKGLIPSDTVSDRIADKIYYNGKKSAIKNYYDSIRNNMSSISPYCTEATLTSCKIAEILGYKSNMQGFNILKSLESLGLLSVERNRRLYISNNAFVVDYMEDTSFFRTKSGYLLKQLPNLITI